MRRLFVVLLVLASTSSRANELKVTWLAPEECPPDDELVKRVERLLGRPLSVTLAPRVEAIARAEHTERGDWEVRLLSSTWERRARADSCSGVTDAAALILSLAIPPPEVETAGPPNLLPAQQREFWVGVAADADLGLLPKPSPRFELDVFWLQRPLELQAFVAHGLGQTALGAPRAGAGVRVDVPISGGVRICGVTSWAWRVGLCAGSEAGAMRGIGVGLTRTAVGWAFWVAVVGAAQLEVPLGSVFSVRAEVAAGASLSRPAFTVEGGAAPLYQPGVFFGRGSLGLAGRLW